ncbi:hypothetical protein SCP_0902250 [Sparassis crispa]|uniref:Uncharacterized protein n=1 Tax=Sparassis crispa TaxID=139825 RepID=A0A401GVV3_9APHY|nr:hypothetical protein SCP_0902250 [Sparassis crispa]GBE86346.1 hypothetical protein SCP_0902250 [Sparassis crispa]
MSAGTSEGNSAAGRPTGFSGYLKATGVSVPTRRVESGATRVGTALLDVTGCDSRDWEELCQRNSRGFRFKYPGWFLKKIYD